MDTLKNDSARTLSRTQFVWIAFFVVIPSALFILQIGNQDFKSGMLLVGLSSINERPEVDPVFDGIDDRQSSQWKSIVIQQLSQPAGTVERIERDHRQLGLDGLGYHFLIGNGNGLGDGVIHVGYRWLEQLAAAKPLGSTNWNRDSISICLVGNGDRRPFSEIQIKHLTRLVQRLQAELSVPVDQITFESTGQFFAEAQFRGQLLDIPTSP